MAHLDVQTGTDEAQVRAAIVAAVSGDGVTVTTNEPGSLVIETGSVGKAYLAGPFRGTDKMPVRIQVSTSPSGSGTAVAIEAGSHGGGGFASGGLIGMSKAKKAAAAWAQRVAAAVPQGGGAPAPGQFTT
jgi:hypothetical protein